MKAYIKAAYIFSLLPQSVKSLCLTTLNARQQTRLNRGLQDIASLTIQQEIAILKEAIGAINAIHIHTRHVLDISIIASCVIFAFIAIVSIIVSEGWHQVIQTIYYILQYGGLHAVLLPFIGMYAGKLSGKTLLWLVKPLHVVPDLLMAIAAATAIVIVFSFTLTNETVAITAKTIIALLFAITAVPISEEIFFRGILFLYGGRQYGYIASWFFASFIFAAIHLPRTPLEFAAYFIVSTILCGVAYRFSLFSAIVAHVLSNGILFLQ